MNTGPELTKSGEPPAGPPRGDIHPAKGALARRMEEYRFAPGYRRMFLAAVDAFAEKGFHGTSTRDIAARAGMSPAALYAFFSSKEEALYKIATSAIDLTVDLLAAEAARDGSPAERLEHVVRTFTMWHASHNPVSRVVLYQLEALTPEHLAEVTTKARGIDGIFRTLVRDGVETEAFTVSDVGATVTAIMSLCLDVTRWYRPGNRRAPEEIGDLNARLALCIVCSE
jgi:AcrR family transcriptional regulator